jgi:hypothetical protein
MNSGHYLSLSTCDEMLCIIDYRIKHNEGARKALTKLRGLIIKMQVDEGRKKLAKRV